MTIAKPAFVIIGANTSNKHIINVSISIQSEIEFVYFVPLGANLLPKLTNCYVNFTRKITILFSKFFYFYC